MCSYPLGEVEGSNAQWPETAEHGEDSEPQVVPGRQREEVVFTLTLCRGCITLQNTSWVCDRTQDRPAAMMGGHRQSPLLPKGVWAGSALSAESLNNDPMIPSLGIYHKERV